MRVSFYRRINQRKIFINKTVSSADSFQSFPILNKAGRGYVTTDEVESGCEE
jgi:hypothetical protein